LLEKFFYFMMNIHLDNFIVQKLRLARDNNIFYCSNSFDFKKITIR